LIKIACAAAILGLTGATASADIFAGRLEASKDTSGAGCGQDLGENQFFLYRPKAGNLPASFYISFDGLVALAESADDGGEFDFAGAGHINGTVLFGSTGGAPFVQQDTFTNGTYAIQLTPQSTDDVKQIKKMTISFKLARTKRKCSFQWNGIMTPAFQPNMP
jgi:hypothetical protein